MANTGGRATALWHPPAALAAAALVLLAGVIALRPGAARADEVSPAPANGTWIVDGRGNGHGHGLSQYGARGAAIAGRSAGQIIGFYYPGTLLVTAPPTGIRVQITDNPTYPTVAANPGLALNGVAVATGGTIAAYRLVPFGGGFMAQQRRAGAPWVNYRAIASATADFSRPGFVRTFHADGSYTDYRGTVGGARSGAGQFTINRLSLDDYVRGVIPREMPSGWQTQALQAQAIAARSYARYAVEHPGSLPFDICDTTNCQVYGGMNRYNTANQRVYGEQQETNAAVAATPNQVATWQGRTIFAQFSASNGGVMAAGSQPYLVTKQDPYDNASSGDPYLGYTVSASVGQVAAHYGLSRVTRIRITARAGGGVWGGIVTAAVVEGLDGSGAPTSAQASGPGLASALGVHYQYFHIRNQAPIGRIDSFQMTGLHSLRVRGWGMDPAQPGRSTQVRIYVGSSPRVFAANQPRPDVQAAYHTPIAAYGFDGTVAVPGGTWNVCGYVMDVTLVNHSDLGCRTVTVPVNPTGHVDAIGKVGPGMYRLIGWAFDPDANGGSTQVHVWVDQQPHGYLANLPRADVQRAFGLANAAVGFDIRVPVPAGNHTLCAYAINTVGAGTNQQIRCFVVSG